jgi:hypothetical protein
MLMAAAPSEEAMSQAITWHQFAERVPDLA